MGFQGWRQDKSHPNSTLGGGGGPKVAQNTGFPNSWWASQSVEMGISPITNWAGSLMDAGVTGGTGL